jgi:hypothetical protein
MGGSVDRAALPTRYRITPDGSDKKYRVPVVGSIGLAVIVWLVFGVELLVQVGVPPLGVIV